MAERPILFSSPMVRAILDGRKTVTRRVVRRDVAYIGGRDDNHDDPSLWGVGDIHGCWHVLDQSKPPGEDGGPHGSVYRLRAPYDVGDQLWVRETWGLWRSGRGSWLTESVVGVHRGVLDTWTVAFRADGEADGARWRPSIHMPRWASRITLDVVAVSVERLHDITEEDAAREGVRPEDVAVGNVRVMSEMGPLRYQFVELWDGINGAGSWAANPWVWRVEFRRAT